MLEIAQGLYVPVNRIVSLRIFEKEQVIKVRIAMDTVNAEERVLYSGQMKNMEEAKAFVQNVSNKM